MDKATYPNLKVGARVLTVETNHTATDWAKEALVDRKFNVTGTILRHSDSHGLIYEVQHDDGTKGWYEPWELDTISE